MAERPPDPVTASRHRLVHLTPLDSGPLPTPEIRDNLVSANPAPFVTRPGQSAAARRARPPGVPDSGLCASIFDFSGHIAIAVREMPGVHQDFPGGLDSIPLPALARKLLGGPARPHHRDQVREGR